MFSKLVLCATNQKLIAGIWRMGQLRSHQVFMQGEEGERAFAEFLQRHKNTPVYLIADAVEEDYRLETLPHTMGGARRELVQRKLSQLYRNSVYRVAHFIGRETTQRKDDKFVMAALTNPDFFKNWLEIIQAQQAPLVGVYLLSMLSQLLVKRMKLTVPNLLFSERLSTGLRQSYFSHGHLQISRLAPITPEAKTKLGFFYLTETEKTRLYLIGQRLIAREAKLTMVLPAHDEQSDSICRDLRQELLTQCDNVDITSLIRGLKLPQVWLHEHPELLHMHLLAIGPVPDNIAPENLTKHYQMHRLLSVLWSTAVGVFLLGASVSGFYAWQSSDYKKQTAEYARDTAQQMRLYNEVAKDFPKTNLSGVDLQRAVALFKLFMGYQQSPERMMKVISRAIAPSPEMQINRLFFLQTNAEKAVDTENESEVLNNDASNQVSNQASPNSASAASVPNPYLVDPSTLRQVAFVNGEIARFNGDYRAALAQVNALVERLRKDNEVAEVTILQWPVNVSSYTYLKGSTTDNPLQQETPAFFKLRITLHAKGPDA